MANTLNCRAVFSQIWNQQKAEAEAFRIRSLERHSIDGLSQSKNVGKIKGNNIVKCIQKKYFSYIIDKIASLTRNSSKALVILAWFLLLFLLLFLLMVSISLAFHLKVFQGELFRISII